MLTQDLVLKPGHYKMLAALQKVGHDHHITAACYLMKIYAHVVIKIRIIFCHFLFLPRQSLP
jgi:hypothetical protein